MKHTRFTETKDRTTNIKNTQRQRKMNVQIEKNNCKEGGFSTAKAEKGRGEHTVPTRLV